MKKTILISIIISLSFLNILAQFDIGYFSGIGTTNIIIDSKPGIIDKSYSEGIGFTMGGLVEYTLIDEHLFLKSGISFSEKGAFYPLYNTLDGSVVSKRRENVYYLESPIILQFKFFPLLKLQAGIYNAIRLNMKKNEYGDYENSYVHYTDRYDLGYIIGVNLEYHRFFLEINYQKGLKSLGKIARWDFNLNKLVLSNESKFYNQNLFFTLGYKLKVSK